MSELAALVLGREARKLTWSPAFIMRLNVTVPGKANVVSVVVPPVSFVYAKYVALVLVVDDTLYST